MNRAKKPPLSTLNDHLICHLCKGYFIDATTIIECLHTFCRSCIVKYLETTKYCPVCDVQVHKSKPLLSLRPDKIVQEIVYKLVPRLFINELQRRKEFHKKHNQNNAAHVAEDLRTIHQNILSLDEELCLRLNYSGATCKPRYFKCPCGVSIMHLQKLIKAKFDLNDLHHIDILYNQDCLNPSYTLMDVVYIYKLSKMEPLDFTYRIYEYVVKKMKLDNKSDKLTNNNNNNWKEVQLRISENGEMSIQTSQNFSQEMIQVLDSAKSPKTEPQPSNDTKIKPSPPAQPQVSAFPTQNNNNNNSKPKLKILSNETILPPRIESRAIAATTTVFTTINSTKCSVVAPPPPLPAPPKPNTDIIENESVKTETSKGIKRSAEEKLNNSHEVKKAKVINSNSLDEKQPNVNRPGTPKPSTKYSGSSQLCYMPKIPPITVPKPPNSPKPPLKIIKTMPSSSSTTSISSSNSNLKPMMSPKIKGSNNTHNSSSPIGYKTLRDPPKSWNSQISKANISQKIPEPKSGELKQVRPAKFFKMRNSMPRFLGNPASGVKPMYSLPEKSEDKNTSGALPVENREIKKHSIVKIDPKTLKPISEKAPETSSLSKQVDLKINTSSVSIFNPLKLQSSSSSPKGSERKSPKSPQSPKTVSPPVIKRDKPNLNFTPPNPFIPNLTSQTISPNQFLGPPGFPSYDPRVMAAYHNLFYGSPMGHFQPYHLAGLAEMNRGKNFDISKIVGGVLQQSATTTSTTTTTTPSVVNNKPNNCDVVKLKSTTQNSDNLEISKSTPTLKSVQQRKDVSKNEKSLQNAVEKLTLSRAKEIDKLNKISENLKSEDVKNPKQETVTNSKDQIKEDDVEISAKNNKEKCVEVVEEVKPKSEETAAPPPPPPEKINENHPNEESQSKTQEKVEPSAPSAPPPEAKPSEETQTQSSNIVEKCTEIAENPKPEPEKSASSNNENAEKTEQSEIVKTDAGVEVEEK